MLHRVPFDVTDSTNAQARRLAGERPGERLLVTAAEQTAGRGRRGRAWHSPRGGAWLSIAWPLTRPPENYAAASLAAAAAVRRAVCRVAPALDQRLRIKWPNDVLADGRKVAGILCEQFLASGGGGDGGVLIVGVGVNVDLDFGPTAGALRFPATTLRDTLGAAIAVDAVVDAVAAELEPALERIERDGLDAALLAELRAHLAFVGEVRTWTGPAGEATGRVLGLDDAGRLLLESNAGAMTCETGEFAAALPH
jgi:BirA family biotin operon repressor/biotin-[acetyl-CoA-carboxylase] ligase